MEQKLAAYRHHIERMLRLPLNRTRQLGMENHIPHSHSKQLPNHPTTKTETANTTPNNNPTPK